MKRLCAVLLLLILVGSATIYTAQSGVSPTPPTQSAQTTPAAPPSSEKKSLGEQDKQKKDSEISQLIDRYRWKGNWYLALYYIFVLGAALASALAGLLLQWDTPDKPYKRLAQILAFVASALAIVTTSVNFKVQSAANKTAYMECRDLRIKVTAGSLSDILAIDKEILDIEKRKTELALK